MSFPLMTPASVGNHGLARMGWGWCGGQERGFIHDLLFLWGGILGVTMCLFLP